MRSWVVGSSAACLCACSQPDVRPFALDEPGTAVFARTSLPYYGDVLYLVIAEGDAGCELFDDVSMYQLSSRVEDGLLFQLRPEWLIGTDGGLEGLYVDQQLEAYFGDDIDPDVRGTAYASAVNPSGNGGYPVAMYVPSWVQLTEVRDGRARGKTDAWLWEGGFDAEDCGTVELRGYYYYYEGDTG